MHLRCGITLCTCAGQPLGLTLAWLAACSHACSRAALHTWLCRRTHMRAENRCGSSYSDAVSQCSKCPGGIDSECAAGERCYAKVPACPGPAPTPPTPPPTPPSAPPTPPPTPDPTPTPEPPTDCGDSAGETYDTLSCEQLEYAQIIMDVGKDNDIPKYGWVIALATAMQVRSSGVGAAV